MPELQGVQCVLFVECEAGAPSAFPVRFFRNANGGDGEPGFMRRAMRARDLMMHESGRWELGLDLQVYVWQFSKESSPRIDAIRDDKAQEIYQRFVAAELCAVPYV